ncbi:DUF4234 domain-containing protein [Heyndrickxia camelliae]|uniref:DUF4234 domain-containing protein n=1 Tax=Heyndrickxia camelliae TaxID=1707093 RepID=A0A2N3LCU7_9BACI|nr:hypothetical protein CWO92_24760 [Heyndrickxia camelliae]
MFINLLGIYYLYWIYQTSDRLIVSNKSKSPAVEVILGIITLRFYFLNWYYKTAKQVYEYAQAKGYRGIPD